MRARRISQAVWEATRWLLTFLGTAAVFTFGLQVAQTNNASGWSSILIASVSVICGMLAYAFSQIVTLSRIRAADSAAQKRKVAYLLLCLSLVVQVFALPVAAGFQGLAVAQVMDGSSAQYAIVQRLAARIDLYGQGSGSPEFVLAYCKKHYADELVNSAFLAACDKFSQGERPTAEESALIAADLRLLP